MYAQLIRDIWGGRQRNALSGNSAKSRFSPWVETVMLAAVLVRLAGAMPGVSLLHWHGTGGFAHSHAGGGLPHDHGEHSSDDSGSEDDTSGFGTYYSPTVARIEEGVAPPATAVEAPALEPPARRTPNPGRPAFEADFPARAPPG